MTTQKHIAPMCSLCVEEDDITDKEATFICAHLDAKDNPAGWAFVCSGHANCWYANSYKFAPIPIGSAPSTDTLFYCDTCGELEDIQLTAWYYPNTGAMSDGDGPCEHGWCGNCDSERIDIMKRDDNVDACLKHLRETFDLALFLDQQAELGESSERHVWITRDHTDALTWRADTPEGFDEKWFKIPVVKRTPNAQLACVRSNYVDEMEEHLEELREREERKREPACGHSVCSQHYCDTGHNVCVKEGEELPPEVLRAIDQLSDELFATGEFRVKRAKDAGREPELVDLLRTTIGSYLSCVVSDKGWLEETFGGFEVGLRQELRATRKEPNLNIRELLSKKEG